MLGELAWGKRTGPSASSIAPLGQLQHLPQGHPRHARRQVQGPEARLPNKSLCHPCAHAVSMSPVQSL